MSCWQKIVIVLLLLPVEAFAQEPAHPGQLFSSDLVSWTYMQEPEPQERQHAQQRPEPTPETQPSSNPAQPGPRPGFPEAAPNQVRATFIGIVNKQSEGYVLKVSGAASYRLDNGPELEQYEGRRVRITGTLDQASNLIHVEKVEPLPEETHQPS